MSDTSGTSADGTARGPFRDEATRGSSNDASAKPASRPRARRGAAALSAALEAASSAADSAAAESADASGSSPETGGAGALPAAIADATLLSGDAVHASMSEADREALRRAVRALEHPSLAARLSLAAGAPLDVLGRAMPESVTQTVAQATDLALRTALKVALATLPREGAAGEVESLGDAPEPRGSGADDPAETALPAEPRRVPRFIPADLAHKALAALSGAVGGAFGLASVAVELPVSTTLMLRAIAEIARREGEDLADPEAALACVQVFALGGRAGTDALRDAAASREVALAGEERALGAESGYFAVRAALARTTAEAARYVAAHRVLEEGAPALVRFASQIAARFGLVVSQKLAAGALPIIGALGGAAVNTAFMDHFQGIARAHFTVRRLERSHGREAVRAAYEAERLALG